MHCIFIHTEVWISYAFVIINVPYFQDGIRSLRTDSNRRHYKDQRDKVEHIMRKKECFSLHVVKSFGFKSLSQIQTVTPPHIQQLATMRTTWRLGAIFSSSHIFTTAGIHFNCMAELRIRRNLTACSVAKSYIQTSREKSKIRRYPKLIVSQFLCYLGNPWGSCCPASLLIKKKIQFNYSFNQITRNQYTQNVLSFWKPDQH